MYMLTFILITAISFCLLCIGIQMNKIGQQYKEAKLHKEKEKQYL